MKAVKSSSATAVRTQRSIQARVDAKPAKKPAKKAATANAKVAKKAALKAAKKPVQAGSRREPVPPMRSQHLLKPCRVQACHRRH